MVPGKQLCLPGTVAIQCLLIAGAAGRTAGSGLFFRLVAGAAGGTAGRRLLFRLIPRSAGRTAGRSRAGFYLLAPTKQI